MESIIFIGDRNKGWYGGASPSISKIAEQLKQLHW